MNRNDNNKLEKHYTSTQMIDEMYDVVKRNFNTNDITEIQETSAGGGAIIDYFKDKGYKNITAYDIENETNRPDIKECNYLKEVIEYKKGRVTVQNPPFIYTQKFIKKALSESDYLVTITPLSSIMNLDYNTIEVDEINIYRKVEFNTGLKIDICIMGLKRKS
jgi:hypothetical protein